MAIVACTKERFKLRAVFDFAGRFIYHASHEETEHNRICSAELDNTMQRFLIKMGTICMAMAIGVIQPTYAYFAHGIRTTWTSDRIPFTELNSDAEFMINISLQSFIITHGLFAYFALGVIMALIENAVTVTPRVSICSLASAIRQYKDKTSTELELRCTMNNFVKSTHDMDK